MRKNPTPAEAALWQTLRKKKLGIRFRRQACMWGYIADVYAPSIALCVEADGCYHQHDTDRARDAALLRRGITTLRFTNFQILHSVEVVLDQIRNFANSQRISKKAKPGAITQRGKIGSQPTAINTP